MVVDREARTLHRRKRDWSACLSHENRHQSSSARAQPTEASDTHSHRASRTPVTRVSFTSLGDLLLTRRSFANVSTHSAHRRPVASSSPSSWAATAEVRVRREDRETDPRTERGDASARAARRAGVTAGLEAVVTETASAPRASFSDVDAIDASGSPAASFSSSTSSNTPESVRLTVSATRSRSTWAVLETWGARPSLSSSPRRPSPQDRDGDEALSLPRKREATAGEMGGRRADRRLADKDAGRERTDAAAAASVTSG